MKALAVLFLFALLFTTVSAEERLIPFDDFLISADLNGPRERESKKLRVSVMVRRMADDPKPRSLTSVDCPELVSWHRLLNRDDQAALVAAGAAALSGQEYRRECGARTTKTVYEVVTVDGGKRVRLRTGGAPSWAAKEANKVNEVLFAPEEAVRLKDTLAEAEAAEAWYKLLLTETQLPVKTAAAHPPRASGYEFISKVGEVCGDIRKAGLGYEATVYHFNLDQKRQHDVWHGLQFYYYGEHRGTTIYSGDHMGNSDPDWRKPMMDQVELALEAVGKQQVFTFESPPGAMGAHGATNDTNFKFTVTANLATQQADVRFIPGYPIGLYGETHTGGSFGVAHLAAIRELKARVDAREKWCTEHEGWFFEGQVGK